MTSAPISSTSSPKTLTALVVPWSLLPRREWQVEETRPHQPHDSNRGYSYHDVEISRIGLEPLFGVYCIKSDSLRVALPLS